MRRIRPLDFPALLLLALTVARPVAAEDGGIELAADAAVSGVEVSQRLQVISALGTGNSRMQMLEALFEPQIKLDLGPQVKLDVIGRARADAFAELEPGSPGQPEVAEISRRALVGSNADLALRECYVELDLDWAYLTLGKQQVVWGQADGLKVLDVVNPQDFRLFILDKFSDSRIPLWAVDVEVPLGGLKLEGVWVLDQTYHDLPESDALFAFSSPLFVPPVPPGVPLAVEPPDRPSRVIADSDVGLRLSTFYAGWDLTLNYLYHYDDVPAFVRRPGTVGGAPGVIVTPEYYRTQLLGGTFSNAFGDLTVRGEVATFFGRTFSTGSVIDSDGVVQSDELAYVIGLDWYALAETMVSLQFFESRVLDHERGLFRDRTEDNVTLMVRHEMLHDTLLLEALWLYGLNRGDGLLRPKVTYQLNDHTTAWLGYDLFHGGPGGVFGQFDANDRLVLGIEWAF